MTSFMCLVFAITAITAVSATQYGHFVGKHEYAMTPMDMSLDADHMITIPGTPQPLLPSFTQTINYHDFITGFVAHKDIDRRECYIRSTNETYTWAESLFENKVNDTETYVNQQLIYAVKSPYSHDHAGIGIQEFCRGYESYPLRIEGNPGRQRTTTGFVVSISALVWIE